MMGHVQREKPTHSFSGDKWKTNITNKKYLRVDFHERCAYCDDWDFYCGGKRTFHVDHFAPKAKFSHLKIRYENLLYTCSYCNEAKSDKWVSNDASVCVIGDEGFVNPCLQEYDNHLERNDKGEIVAKTELGKYIVRELKLYLNRHRIIYTLDQIRKKQRAIEEKIAERKANGTDFTELEDALTILNRDFFKYYGLFEDLEE